MSSWPYLREGITNGAMFGMAVAWLFVFFLVAVNGWVKIAEARPLILAGEILLVLGVAILAAFNIITLLRRIKG